MKNVFTVTMFVIFSFAVSAQSDVSPKKNYDQKKFLDSLQKTFGQQAIQINPQLQLAYKAPVIPLKNEGERTGMTGEDTIYRMNTDNMLIVKPNTKTTYIPNAAEGKVFMLPQVKKKP